MVNSLLLIDWIFVINNCSVIRSGGTFGSVAIQWALSPTDSTVFTSTSATEVFADGQNLLNFTVSVSYSRTIIIGIMF